MKNYIFNYKHSIFLVLLIFYLHSISKAQVSEGGWPVSFRQTKTKAAKQIPLITMPSFDIPAMLKEDANQIQTKPFRFAKSFDVSYSLNNSGLWESLNDGGKLWRLSIKSAGAYSINIIFRDFNIPEGSKLFIYNKDKSDVIGAFTSKNNSASKVLATIPVEGDEVSVEYYEPKVVNRNGTFTIAKISHDYKGILKNCFDLPEGGSCYGSSGACNIDINCTEGDYWQKEKRAVARIFVEGSWLCTGALIGSPSQCCAPYLLTAHHCVCDDYVAQTVVAVFNYESSTCHGSDGSLSQSVSGAYMRARSSSSSDFALIELSSMPDSYMPYYLGWDISDNNPSLPVTCIHHPNADVKKISVENHTLDKVSINDYQGDYCDRNVAKATWHIPSWEKGTTEPGSSGAPLFDNNHRVIGQLYAGKATCSDPYNDYFGRIAVSWIGGGTMNSSLGLWLDGGGSTTFDGWDPCPYDLNIPYNIKGGRLRFAANNSITANNTIYGGAIVYYGANNSVRLTTGFRVVPLMVPPYTSFHAGLNGCTESLKSAQDKSQVTKNANSKDIRLYPGNVVLYPNPTNGNLNVEGMTDFEVNVFDLSERKVLNITKASGSFNISILKSGIYIVHLKSAGKTYIHKVVKL